MSLIKWSPLFEEWENMEKALRDWQIPMEKTFIPAIDVYKEKGNVMVKTAITGIDPKDIKIEVDNNILTIRGKTEKKSEVDEKNYYRREIKHGSFQRSVMLPGEVNSDKIVADYEDGVLKITAPLIKEVKDKSKKIAVNIKKKSKFKK